MLGSLIVLTFMGCGPRPASIKLDGDPVVTLNSFDAIPLKKAHLLDKNGAVVKTSAKPTWTVSPENVARLEGSALKPLSNGEATVMVSANNLKAQYQVVVAVPDRIAIQGYTSGSTIEVGGVALLKADVMAGDKIVAGQLVAWKSSDDRVASVSNGKILGMSPGVVTLSAVSGALEARLELHVVEKPAGEPDAKVGDLKVVKAQQPTRSASGGNSGAKDQTRGKNRKK